MRTFGTTIKYTIPVDSTSNAQLVDKCYAGPGKWVEKRDRPPRLKAESLRY